MAVLILIGLII
uniref:Uncharacterized protein n=1 Tax=Anguilla anguilla TaxID=7936 RepID=A0A0E9T0P3_ANGAN